MRANARTGSFVLARPNMAGLRRQREGDRGLDRPAAGGGFHVTVRNYADVECEKTLTPASPTQRVCCGVLAVGA